LYRIGTGNRFSEKTPNYCHCCEGWQFLTKKPTFYMITIKNLERLPKTLIAAISVGDKLIFEGGALFAATVVELHDKYFIVQTPDKYGEEIFYKVSYSGWCNELENNESLTFAQAVYKVIQPKIVSVDICGETHSLEVKHIEVDDFKTTVILRETKSNVIDLGKPVKITSYHKSGNTRIEVRYRKGKSWGQVGQCFECHATF